MAGSSITSDISARLLPTGNGEPAAAADLQSSIGQSEDQSGINACASFARQCSRVLEAATKS
jgi:hypothetical protein